MVWCSSFCHLTTSHVKSFACAQRFGAPTQNHKTMLTDFIDTRTANVYGIYGHLGGGKTLTAVEISLWALSKGWPVSSNIFIKHIPSNSDCYHFHEDINREDFWKLPQGAPRGDPSPLRSVIVIDECAEFFDQYSSTAPQVKSFLSWLRHSSKRGQFVFLIVQQPEFIAKSLRILINKWISCVDMYQLRLPLVYIRPPFCGNFVARFVFDKWGNKISRGFNLANKTEIGYYYNTSQSIALAGRDEDKPAEEVDDLPPVPNQQTILLIVVIYIIYTLYWL